MIEEFEKIWTAAPPYDFPWQGVVAIALSISFVLVALLYALAKLFRSKEVEQRARAEFLVALSTLFIAGAIVAFIGFFSSVVLTLTLESVRFAAPQYFIAIKQAIANGVLKPELAHFAPAQAYISSLLSCARVLYVRNTAVAMLYLPIAELYGEATRAETYPVIVIANLVNAVNYSLGYALSLLYLQKHLLIFLQQVALTVFLPIGIALRALPPTRGTGNIFIAISMGGYFVYPTSYSIVLTISHPAQSIESKCGITADTEISLVGGFAKALAGAGLPMLVGNILSYLTGRIFKASHKLQMLAGYVGLSGAMYAYYESIKPMIIEFYIYAGIYVLVAGAITLTFIKFFASWLGVETQEFIQGLFRML